MELFIAWGASRYKYNTILSTVSALIDWCISKGAPRDSLTCSAVTRLLKTVKAEQGPAGLPFGKTGMSKDLLGKLLTHVAVEAKSRPTFAPLLFRDSAWLVLGFFGLLRRSELVALRMSDVVLTGTGTNSFITVRIRHSKTDRQGAGVDVLITGHTCGGWDLTSKVARFQKLRLLAGAGPEDPFLVGWDLDTLRQKKKGLANGEASRLHKHLHDLLQIHPDLVVNPQSYGMHNLRRGGVLAAWKAGVDIEKIRAHGRWKSDAVRAYMTAGWDIKLAVTPVM